MGEFSSQKTRLTTIILEEIVWLIIKKIKNRESL